MFIEITQNQFILRLCVSTIIIIVVAHVCTYEVVLELTS